MSDPPWLREARKLLGTREIPGPASNPVIEEMHSRVSGVAHKDDVPWCAAFVGWCLEQAGIESSNSLMARSYVPWGEKVLGEPTVGAIVVFSSSRGPASGHVAFCVGVSPSRIEVLGGNQGDRVSIASYPRSKIVAVRWPKGFPRGAVRAAGGGAEIDPSDA